MKTSVLAKIADLNNNAREIDWMLDSMTRNIATASRSYGGPIESISGTRPKHLIYERVEGDGEKAKTVFHQWIAKPVSKKSVVISYAGKLSAKKTAQSVKGFANKIANSLVGYPGVGAGQFAVKPLVEQFTAKPPDWLKHMGKNPMNSPSKPMAAPKPATATTGMAARPLR